MSTASQLLAYTYIDLIVQISRQSPMIEDANSIFDDLMKIDNQWYLHLDDEEAKEALREALKLIRVPARHFDINIPGELL